MNSSVLSTKPASGASNSITASNIILQADSVVKQVSNRGQQLTILAGLNLSVSRAETLALIGRSGAGKSTLLALLAGLDVPSSGKIHLLGENLADLSEDERAQLRAGQVGFVFQSFQLLGGLTALDNVMLPLELAGATDARAKAENALETVGLADRLTHRPQQLSGGEQQRVALARAFAVKPKLLFADEPTGNLDAATGEQIIELLFQLNSTQETTLVLVTHDKALAQLCGRQLTLENGRLHDS